MTQPIVSILVPCFQAAAFLPELFACLERIPGDGIEVVLVDDGSTDGTAELISHYAKESRHAAIALHQTNRGASAARNHAFRSSRGRFIQYLDADDLIAPDKLALQIASLEAHEESINASAWGRFDKNPESTEFVPVPEPSLLTASEYLRRHLAEGLMTHPAAFVVRRDLIERTGGFREDLSLNDDGEFFARLIAAAGHIRFIANARSHYRSNLRTSYSARRAPESLQSAATAIVATADIASSIDGSERMRRAQGQGLARVAAYLAPHDREIAEATMAEAKARWPDAAWTEGTRTFRWLAPWVGWILARRMEFHVANLRKMLTSRP